MQVHCPFAALVSFITLVGSLVAFAYGTLKLTTHDMVNVTTTVKSSTDLYEHRFGTLLSGESTGKHGYTQNMDVLDEASEKSYFIQGPCRIPLHLTRLKKNGMSIRNVKGSSTMECGEEEWNVCRLEVEFDYNGHGYKKTLDVPDNEPCHNTFPEGRKYDFYYDPGSGTLQEETRESTKSQGLTYMAGGAAVLFLSGVFLLQSTTKDGCDRFYNVMSMAVHSGAVVAGGMMERNNRGKK